MQQVRCSPGREVDDDGGAVACDEGALVHAREGSARVVAYTPAACTPHLLWSSAP